MIDVSERGVAIVIEGQGGAGKTTAAQILASQYGLNNFNTGTLFRATSTAILMEGVHSSDVDDFVEEAHFDVESSGLLEPMVAVNGVEVTEFLQLPEVTKVASLVGGSEVASNRLEDIFNTSVSKGNVVIEGKKLADSLGRSATHMFFLAATLEVRTLRKWRQAQLLGRGDYTPQEALFDTASNDKRDRGLLQAPKFTNIINTSDLTPVEVVAEIARSAQLE